MATEQWRNGQLLLKLLPYQTTVAITDCFMTWWITFTIPCIISRNKERAQNDMVIDQLPHLPDSSEGEGLNLGCGLLPTLALLFWWYWEFQSKRCMLGLSKFTQVWIWVFLLSVYNPREEKWFGYWMDGWTTCPVAGDHSRVYSASLPQVSWQAPLHSRP